MATKRWTKDDESILKEKFKNMSNKELASLFGVSTIAIQRKLSRMGLIRQNQKKWTRDEEEYLREHFMKQKDKELALHFKVSEIAIRRKLNRLGLKRNEKRAKDANKLAKKKVYKKEYSMFSKYELGESIYHKVFDDEGKVDEKFKTDEGLDIIVVKFNKRGITKLVECIEPSLE
jgi:Zn-dependent peptidase ImmA (M78 family)